MSERTAVVAGALVGALAGAAAAYLFFTTRGHELRERMEPTVEHLRREMKRFQRTLEKLGDMAGEGMRVVQEFSARAQAQYSEANDRTPH